MKDLLLKKDITQKKLAFEMNVTQQTISLWCLNKARPQLEMLPKLAKALDVTIEEVVNCFNKKEEG